MVSAAVRCWLVHNVAWPIEHVHPLCDWLRQPWRWFDSANDNTLHVVRSLLFQVSVNCDKKVVYDWVANLCGLLKVRNWRNVMEI